MKHLEQIFASTLLHRDRKPKYMSKSSKKNHSFLLLGLLIRNSLVALLEALFAQVFLGLRSRCIVIFFF